MILFTRKIFSAQSELAGVVCQSKTDRNQVKKIIITATVLTIAVLAVPVSLVMYAVRSMAQSNAGADIFELTEEDEKEIWEELNDH